MKNILLTGVTGFIGSEILSRLILDPSRPRLSILARKKPDLDNSLLARRFAERGISPQMIEELHWIETSFEDEASFRSVLNQLPDQFDRVLHLAAIIKATSKNAAQERLNQGVTQDLLDFANTRKAAFYYMSSVVAFGATLRPDVRHEKDFDRWEPFNNRFPYFSTKRAAHEQVLKNAHVGGCLFCPSIVHGSLELEKNSRAHLQALRDGKLPFAPSAGANFVSLEDVAGPVVEMLLKDSEPMQMKTRLLVGTNMSFVEYFKLYQETFAEYLLSKGRDISHIRKNITRLPEWFSNAVIWNNRILEKYGVKLSALQSIEQSAAYLYFESEYQKSDLPTLDDLRAALLRSFQGMV